MVPSMSKRTSFIGRSASSDVERSSRGRPGESQGGGGPSGGRGAGGGPAVVRGQGLVGRGAGAAREHHAGDDGRGAEPLGGGRPLAEAGPRDEERDDRLE